MNPNGVLVFYCKDCGKMFFAVVNEPRWIEAAAVDIARNAAEGHRSAIVSDAVVRIDFAGCQCVDATSDVTQRELFA